MDQQYDVELLPGGLQRLAAARAAGCPAAAAVGSGGAAAADSRRMRPGAQRLPRPANAYGGHGNGNSGDGSGQDGSVAQWEDEPGCG
eukprot:364831-Chlamydomonas_euryale.AAC.5